MARTKQTAKKSAAAGKRGHERDEDEGGYRLRKQLATKTGSSSSSSNRRFQPKYRELTPIKYSQKRVHKKGQ
jgi:hypothetical protein